MSDFRTYTKFTRHVNNAQETIDANHKNTIQTAVNNTESSVTELYQKAFIDKVLFTFDNNFFVNALFVDELNDQQYVDISKSTGIMFNDKRRCIEIAPDESMATFVSTHRQNEYESFINDFILMSDHHIPLGASIKYYVSCNGQDYYPIKENQDSTPLNLASAQGTSIRLKAVMRRNAQGETPRLAGWAIMYFDPMLENIYGMKNPDLRRFTEQTAGTTILVRDRAKEDKLVRVIEPNIITELFYHEDGSLSHITTNDGVAKLKDTLLYGDYYNSSGTHETVLLGISSEMADLDDSLDPDDIFDDVPDEDEEEVI